MGGYLSGPTVYIVTTLATWILEFDPPVNGVSYYVVVPRYLGCHGLSLESGKVREKWVMRLLLSCYDEWLAICTYGGTARLILHSMTRRSSTQGFCMQSWSSFLIMSSCHAWACTCGST